MSPLLEIGLATAQGSCSYYQVDVETVEEPWPSKVILMAKGFQVPNYWEFLMHFSPFSVDLECSPVIFLSVYSQPWVCHTALPLRSTLFLILSSLLASLKHYEVKQLRCQVLLGGQPSAPNSNSPHTHIVYDSKELMPLWVTISRNWGFERKLLNYLCIIGLNEKIITINMKLSQVSQKYFNTWITDFGL